jgi:hypothetical protein
LDLKKQSVRTISIRASIAKLCDKLRIGGFMHPIKNQASSCQKLLFLSEDKIIKYYNSVMRGILNWFSGADNFYRVKAVIESVMRRSCLLTLKRKFKLKSMAETIGIYTKDVAIIIKDKPTTKLITREEITKMPNTFNIGSDSVTGCIKEHVNWETIMNQVHFRSHGLEFFKQCAVENCHNQDIEIHHMRRLERRINTNDMTSIKDSKGNRATGLKGFLSAINRKQMPLCKEHHRKFEKDEKSPIDKSYFK